jgi:hypothetical protein
MFGLMNIIQVLTNPTSLGGVNNRLLQYELLFALNIGYKSLATIVVIIVLDYICNCRCSNIQFNLCDSILLLESLGTGDLLIRTPLIVHGSESKY